MKLHEVRQRPGVRKGRKRIGRGRGSGYGKTSGRGHKGAKSRSGYRRKPGFEGGQMPLIRRIPKRGFSNYLFRKHWAEINLDQLARFDAGSTVDPAALKAAGLVKGRFHGIVVLGRGDLESALTIRAHRFSKTAAEKIQAAGGTAEVIE
jgi:large subunit ribosomal protein L15